MDKNETIEIFGKSYPLHLVKDFQTGKMVRHQNDVAFKDYLPDFFASQDKHFTAEEYYAKMVEKHPEFKKKWYQKLPSEEQIEQSIIAQLGDAAMDGANSVPKAEKTLGVKVGGGYTYPKGMSDIEYHAYTMQTIGLYTPFNHSITDKDRAYREAWQELHYGPKENMLPVLQGLYKELVALNPELKDVKIDTNDPLDLTYFRAGVTYNFPKEDIQLFVDNKNTKETAKTLHPHIKEKLAENGIPDCFSWVLSDATIDNIAKKLREKEGRETAPDMQNTTIESKEEPKSPKEIVSEKLKSWGIEDGSYLILTPEDNAFKTHGYNEVQSIEPYFKEGEKATKETGKDVVYGVNNGLVGAYFAEGAYVVSSNFQLRSQLYYKGEDNGFGVMLSNGEEFTFSDGTRNDLLNYRWKNAKQKGDDISERIHQQYLQRQKNRERVAQQGKQAGRVPHTDKEVSR